jgi:hypothetical protein
MGGELARVRIQVDQEAPLAALSRAGGQSSRSLRLGVRLGSLAKKPNTKIPIKKNTTE